MYTCTNDMVAGMPNSNGAAFTVNVINQGGTAVNYGDLTIRYWFTPDAGAPVQAAACDYALVMSSNVTMNITDAGAMSYLQIGFLPATSGGMLSGFSMTGPIQIRLHNDPYTNFDQSDDYSFNCSSKGTPIMWDHITAYIGGVLKYGTEPGGASSTGTGGTTADASAGN